MGNYIQIKLLLHRVCTHIFKKMIVKVNARLQYIKIAYRTITPINPTIDTHKQTHTHTHAHTRDILNFSI